MDINNRVVSDESLVNEEQCLIPFSPTDLPDGLSLVFAPHPDDETFGMGGAILKLTKKNQKVVVVLMTDGGAGGNKETRKDEFLKAIKFLGIQDYFFFNSPDRGLQVNVESIKKVIGLLNDYKPKNVFFPSPLEYHPDHRATSWLVWNSIQHIDFEVNCYSYEIGNQSQANVLVDITDVINEKIEAMNLYASQLMQNNYIEKIIAINRSRSYTLAKEVFFAEAFFNFSALSSDLMSSFYNHHNKYRKGFSSESLPLVSILIRTKNRPKLLENALLSVKNQSYQQFEVNIVNDGGESIENIVDKFEFEHSYVKNHEISKGRASAANALLTMINGEYAIFLDDDDVFDSDHLENLVTVIKKNTNMLVCYSGVRVGNNMKNKAAYNNHYNAALLRHGNYIPIHALLFSKKLVDIGCHFDESFHIYEDWDFWLQLAQHTNFHHIDKITATYHVNGDSGAGESNKKNNEADYVLKIYEKWSKIWSASQLAQTFQALRDSNLVQLQGEREKNQYIINYKNEELKNKEEKINTIMSELEFVKVIGFHLNNHIDSLLKERILVNTVSSSKKRDFTLVSARNYELQCMTLFEEVFKIPMSNEFWNWKYEYGENVKWRGICAMKNNRIIAHYNGMPRSIMFFGEHRQAFQACDVMVSPHDRGGIKDNSPFYNIAKTWINTNIGAGKDFLMAFGFPNKRSMLLGEKLGLYTKVDVIVEVCWNTQEVNYRHELILEEYKSMPEYNDQINQLWENMALDFKEDIIGIRNAEYLMRRYLNHPVKKYNIYLVRDESNHLLAAFVLKREGKNMSLMDVISIKKYFKMTIESACRVTVNAGCERLTCWITGSKSKLFDCCNGLIKEIDVSIPSAITPEFTSDLVKDKWFLMYGDTDFL